ncbi:MAG TPA: hypothetical protein VFN67_17480 [Polyangiales bacterium]|jgi:hypothetical protein|nr:hypothetical protein [Polyangiales bacterium]
MSEASMERMSEPNEAELQHTAQAARDALASSLSRLDDRVKHIRSTAVEASAASGLGIAAVCTWWLSMAIDRPRHRNGFARRPPLGALVLTTALKAASLALTGALVYASYRHARKVAES